jgi:hypothetical protein
MAEFRYHALAKGLKVQFHSPKKVDLPAVAAIELKPEGGLHTAREDTFRFDSMVSARSVQAVVSGAADEDGESIDELASVVVEDLNVLGVVTADRIVARIAAVHRKEGPPSITPLGSHFENLKIAGKKIEVDLAVDTFTRLDTAEKLHSAYESNDGGFREEFANLSLLGKIKTIPSRLHRYFPAGAKESAETLPVEDDVVRVGLVRRIEGIPAGAENHGHVIHIPGFGVIRLAEISIERRARELKMVQIDLGSTPKGCVVAGHVRGNGSGW